ncbi:M81 family metallopeptidase [Tuwongella immobilis]|uniref:Microcystin LR degradation protein MlrC N-terminal domain-containing protein n=1 Tax=Tuwongella immobilis TaxID=692036 RepID=A0A6C2YK72_9BACT|nr:M81 family metallopeptidase [Tuwongella immobilis]VIP01505.1 Uncharacterized protein OS=Planctomyces maris DSM 8797 GN=PM8797T_18756 PE=4 SV=1: DUF1485: MlrC_C [Tuwongella immobilis]VTR98607.1 Uncharacterized protein OS=Planctomyces maris DSM 8797 GN=PM8797T_18756 PE=4 SV=1: DUF1485: MlrC_C [Tuwongella immobilis]
MRVGIVALLQESNTFLSRQTTLAHFEQDMLLTGEAIRERMGDAHHEIGGFFAGLRDAQMEAVPIFAARALPFGAVTDEAVAALLNRMLAAVDAAGPIDGMLVAPHGATAGVNVLDVDGFWLMNLRAHLGSKIPIIGTLDLHANLSPAMVAATNALIAYRMNPHLDQRQRGWDAANLMARTLRGEIKPTQAAAFPPLIINIERQDTGSEPLQSITEKADRMQEQPGVLSNSLLLGFPYADVPEMGSATLVVTDNDASRAQHLANELAMLLWQRREEFRGQYLSPADAFREAASVEHGPVTLLDMGDNVGGGSSADGTILAHEALRQNVGPTFVTIFDPEATQRARDAGISAKLRLTIGGKTDTLHGPPLDVEVVVKGRYDGVFHETEPRHGGMRSFDQGPSAVVQTRDRVLTILLTSRRVAPFSLAGVVGCHIDPKAFRVLIAKGVHAPVAAYGPVSTRLIRVNTPGSTTADVESLTFQHRRKPMFPFEGETTWQAE